MKAEIKATPKERPILFNGEMVRATLDDRKTMTRRVCKPAEDAALSYVVTCENSQWGDEEGDVLFSCPYGKVGDRLWVRETFVQPEIGHHKCPVYYRANEEDALFIGNQYKWKPSIFMPRWASRITLEITVIRIERLNDITHEDAKSEGVETTTFPSFAGSPFPCWKGYGKGKAYLDTALDSFKSLWRSINGEESWAENPWVWVVEFKQVVA